MDKTLIDIDNRRGANFLKHSEHTLTIQWEQNSNRNSK